jgi:prepilin-type N-terminal cleavage/methylation domain-containing protein
MTTKSTMRNSLTMRRHAGFTMIELMISIALVLILLLGVNYVFRTAVDSIGAGEQVIQFTQDSRAVSGALLNDFNNVASDPPCFIIASQIVPQYLNAADAQNGTDPRVWVDTASGTSSVLQGTYNTYIYGNPLGLQSPPYYTVSPAIPNNRDHRSDMVRFFVLGLFPRRTGNDVTFFSSTTSTAQDAFVTIGHAMLPTVDASVYVGPTTDGYGTPPGSPFTLLPIPGHLVQSLYPPGIGNPPNYDVGGVTPTQRIGGYASDWVLARNVTLLRDPNTISGDNYYPRMVPTIAAPAVAPQWYGNNVTPLGNDSPDNSGTGGGIQSSRYDLAGRTMEQIRRDLADAILFQGGLTSSGIPSGGQGYPMNFWWNPFVYNIGAVFRPTATNPNFYDFETCGSIPSNPPPFSGLQHAVTPDLARMNANPQVPTPLTAQGVALMSPYFLPHVSQFIVEYAGDYLQQNSNPTDPNGEFGAITGLGQDGQIDFVVDGNGNRRIRWYGMPRSTSGIPNQPSGSNILIRGFDPVNDSFDPTTQLGMQKNAKIMQAMIDVIPLRDYFWMWYLSNGVTAAQIQANPATYTPSWEVDVNFDPTRDYGAPALWSSGLNNAFQVTYNANYPTPQVPAQPGAQAQGAANARYACAWYNDMPAMIRILIKVDDPNNKVKDGPWYEYVFKLK